MKTKTIYTLASLVVVLIALITGGYALYSAGLRHGSLAAAPQDSPHPATPAAASATDMSSIAAGEEATRRHIKNGLKAGDIDPANGQQVLYYHDPMVPGKRFDAPAKSPFMDMMLVPVYAGAQSADGSHVTVSPRVEQNLGLRTAEVVQGSLATQLSSIGSIAWNERDQSVIQARAAGYIEKLYVRATFDAVRAGQPFADVYVPEWVAAQQEFSAIKKTAGNDLPLVAAARQRLLIAGMTEAQVARFEATGNAQARTTLTASSSGVVAELVAREGMVVTPGMTLARINGLATVWALADIPESQVALLQTGANVEARSAAVPGTVFNGTVQALLPDVALATRTLKARVLLANPGNALAPGMLVTLQFMDKRSTPALLVPTEAIIATGQRTVVMLAEDKGRYRPVNVETGIESGGQTEVKKGLTAGQRVVVSSQFLIDSEASLKGVEARLNNEPPAKPVVHQGEGRIDAIDKDAITLTHGPIPSVGWGSMTMAFKPRPDGLPRNVAVGDKVQFEFVMPKDGEPTLTGISPILPDRSSTTAPRAGAPR